MDLREVGWKGVDWIHLAQDRSKWRAIVDTVMNVRVPYKVGKFLTSKVTVSFLRRDLLHVELAGDINLTQLTQNWFQSRRFWC
jgi:hypothetical protein